MSDGESLDGLRPQALGWSADVGWRERRRQRRARRFAGPGGPEFQFPVRFLLFATLLMAGWVAMTPAYPVLTALTAEAAALVSRALGLDAVVEPGAHVAFGGSESFRYHINSGCVAGPLVVIFAAAVVAYPATRRQRVIALVIGLPGLLVANLARLVVLGWVGVNAPEDFDVIHTYWAGSAMPALTGAGWLAWVWFGPRRASRLPPGGTRATAAVPRRPRAISVKPAALLIATFVGSIAVLGVIGVAMGGITVWGHALHAPFAAVARPFDGIYVPSTLPDDGWLTFYGAAYAKLAGVVTLFLITPGVAWRERVRRAFLIGVPLAYLVQLGTLVVRLGVASTLHSPAALGFGGTDAGGLAGTLIGGLMSAVHLGIPAIVWYRWSRR